MPRRGRRGDRGRSGGGAEIHDEEVSDGVGAAEDGKLARTKVFEKTKMCKFFILGCCSRGDACHFAHNKDQMAHLPDLFRTKLCRALINTGRCDNPECRYAHSKEELRVVPGFTGSGGQAKVVGDEAAALGLIPHGPGAGGPKLQQQHFAPQQMQQPQLPQQDSWQQNRLSAGAGGAQWLQAQAAGGGGLSAGGLQQQQQPPQPQAVQQVMAMLMQMPIMQQQMEEASRGDLGRQAALLQMGEAARAHEQEAARLRAMAECLQQVASNGTFPAGVDTSSAPAGVAAAAGGFGHSGVPGLSGSLPQQGSAPARRQTPLPANASVQSAGPSGGQAWAGAAGNKPATALGCSLSPKPADRIHSPYSPEAATPSSEPVQINPGSLRSLSSNSLTGLDPLAEEEPDGAFEERALAQFNALAAHRLEPGTPALAPNSARDGSVEVMQGPMAKGNSPAVSWKVKNTFVEFETERTPVAGRLRNICSAAGRLDALAEQHWDSENEVLVPDTHSATAGMMSGASALQFRRPTDKLSQDASPTTATSDARETSEELAPQAANAAQEESLHASDRPTAEVPALPRLGGLGGSLWNGGATAGVTVKNTFIDFAPEDPSPSMPLRAVHTAAGRLDMMAGLLEEDDDDVAA